MGGIAGLDTGVTDGREARVGVERGSRSLEELWRQSQTLADCGVR